MPFEMITFTDPERDLDGRIVGLKTRPVYSAPQPDEEVWKKKTLKGGHPGLTLSLGWRERAERDGWLLVVEGASDVIAAHHAGLAVSGRPSKDGGFELVARLFATLPGVLPVIACENDRKPDGSWPGKVGERYANKLAGELGRATAFADPPDGAKDFRAWLIDPARAPCPWPERGAKLRAHLDRTAVPSEWRGLDGEAFYVPTVVSQFGRARLLPSRRRSARQEPRPPK